MITHSTVILIIDELVPYLPPDVYYYLSLNKCGIGDDDKKYQITRNILSLALNMIKITTSTEVGGYLAGCCMSLNSFISLFHARNLISCQILYFIKIAIKYREKK